MLPATSNLHSKVAVLLARLVRDDLDSVELEDGARSSLAGFLVVDCGHSFLGSDDARSKWESIIFAL